MHFCFVRYKCQKERWTSKIDQTCLSCCFTAVGENTRSQDKGEKKSESLYGFRVYTKFYTQQITQLVVVVVRLRAWRAMTYHVGEGQVIISTHHFIVGAVGGSLKDFFSLRFLLKHHWKVYNIQNSKLCFCDMKIMSLRNGGDSRKVVTQESFVT